ncbi:hypothetical protein ACWF95_25205 [Streptomyces vinaceus]
MTDSAGAAAGATGLDSRTREAIEQIVQAVRAGDDARIRALLTDLAAVADTAALLYLREQLYAPR